MSRLGEKPGNGPILLCIVFGFAVGEIQSVRKAQVIELDLVESEFGRLDGDLDIVVPDLLVERIGPGQILAVAPERARRVLTARSGLAVASGLSLKTTIRAIV